MCEELCACCCPCCFVCSKRGCGNDCCINMLLGFLCYIPAVVHACMFVGEQKERSVVVNVVNNSSNAPQHQQPMAMYPTPPPQQQAIQHQPAPGGGFYYSPPPQYPQVHQFQPNAPPMYTPQK